jgi:hypothetical protein
MARGLVRRVGDRGRLPSGARRALLIALVTFGLCAAGLVAVAWLADDGSELAIEYEGLD